MSEFGVDAARSIGGEKVVDCDVHPAVFGADTLKPYLNDHWREMVDQRGIGELSSFTYPVHSPLSARSDWRADGPNPAAVSLDQLRSQALDAFGSSYAICNCLYGVQILHSEDMAVAFAQAVNDWIAHEWLDPEPRLRASIVVPMQNPQLAVDEINRCAVDRRFVQVLLLVMGDMPLGKRYYWPIYAAAEKHGLPVAIHAGSTYRHPTTSVGWAASHIEDYASQATAFQAQLTSLICEGVFAKFPTLKFVLSESGLSWLPAHMWRLDKFWHGLRMEVPWLDRLPSEYVKSNIRFTLQPMDVPDSELLLQRIIEHLDSDDLILFSTDYPHWQFRDSVIPKGFSQAQIEKIKVANPLATYPRLQEDLTR